jgi:hypothetical protein
MFRPSKIDLKTTNIKKKERNAKPREGRVEPATSGLRVLGLTGLA